MDKRMVKRMDKQTNGRMDERTIGSMGGRLCVYTGHITKKTLCYNWKRINLPNGVIYSDTALNTIFAAAASAI